MLGQLLGRGRAGRRHRGQDPAARRQDVEVAGALLAHDQLALAAAGEQQVRVRIHEPRGDHAAVGIDARRTSPAASRSPPAPAPRGPAVPTPTTRPSQHATTGAAGAPDRPERRVQHRDVALRRAAAQTAGQRGDLRRAVDEQPRAALGRRPAALDQAGAPSAGPASALARRCGSRSSSAISGEKSRSPMAAAAARRRTSTAASRGTPAWSATSSERGQRGQPDQLRLASATPSSAASAPTVSQARQSGVTAKSSRFIETWARTGWPARLLHLEARCACSRGRPPPDSRTRAGDPLRELHVVGVEVDVPGDQERPGPDRHGPDPRMHPGRPEVRLAAVLARSRREAPRTGRGGRR